MIVRIEDVPKTPKAFQKYVKDWFAPARVMGQECMVASGRLSLDHNDWVKKGKQPGFAPTHTLDSSFEYREGLSKGVNLNRWMDRQKKLVTVLYFEDEDHGNCIEVD